MIAPSRFAQLFCQILGILLPTLVFAQSPEPISLFDGKSLDGWVSNEGIWRVEDGAITAGSHKKHFPRNEFISTEKNYANFELTLKIKCSGDLATGQVNSGIQIRSARMADGGVAGYQIDCGKGWFGKIYDEHRRRLIYPVPLDEAALLKGVDTFGWNTYRILAEGPRIQVWINGIKAIDYTEENPEIPLDGVIAPQIHKGGHVMVQFKEVTIRELAPTPNAPTWESLGGVEEALKKVTPQKKPRKAKGKAKNKGNNAPPVEAKKSTAPESTTQASIESFGKQVSESGIQHSFLIAGSPTVIVGEDGNVNWRTTGKARDGFVLENGNALISIGNVAKEITPDGEMVWSFPLSSENKELGTAVRLENGNTLVVERGPEPRLLEVSPEGHIAVEIPLQPETDNAHMQTRMARKLPNGNYLVPHLLAFAVKEYQPDGKIVRVLKTDLEELGGKEAENWPFTAIRLENGNTLVHLTHGNQIVEFDADGKVTWRVTNKDVGGRFADPCGGQRLANGNTIVCSYGQKDPKKPKLLEITPDKKVVWEYFHPKVKAHEVHVLTTNGSPEGSLK